MTESIYGGAVDVMEMMGWTWDEYLDAPADLVDEIGARLAAKAAAARSPKRGTRGK